MTGSSLLINDNGWLVASVAAESVVAVSAAAVQSLKKKMSDNDNDNSEVETTVNDVTTTAAPTSSMVNKLLEFTPSCYRLMKETNLTPDTLVVVDDISLDNNDDVSSNNTAGSTINTTAAVEKLIHRPNLINCILSVIADIRRMGMPREESTRNGQHPRQRQQQQQHSRHGERNSNRRSRQLFNRVVMMEEQRNARLDNEKSAQKEAETDNHGNDEAASDDNNTNDDGAEEEQLQEEHVDSTISSPTSRRIEHHTMAEQRLASVFNSLRVLIDIVRPMLDHPLCQDESLLKKLLGQKQRGGGAGKYKYCLISKHVYTCVTQKGYNELVREYKSLLNDIQDGLYQRMSSSTSCSKDTNQYDLSTKQWITNLFEQSELFVSNNNDTAEIVASKCMTMMIPTNGARNNENNDNSLLLLPLLHTALIDRITNTNSSSDSTSQQQQHEQQQQQKLLRLAIDRLRDNLTRAITRNFSKKIRLTVYGSCLSGLALEGCHDVDVSIYIPELDVMKCNFDNGLVSAEMYEKKIRRIIFKVRDSLINFNNNSNNYTNNTTAATATTMKFFDLLAITRARVPVIKGKMMAYNPYTTDGSLAFDLCFLNDIAVVNSSLLREYSLYNTNVRYLMLAVKTFAKKYNIANAAEGTLSSYTWLNLVIYYCQCIGLVPVLQCPTLMTQHGIHRDVSNPWHCVNGLNTIYLTSDIVKTRNLWQGNVNNDSMNIGLLLYGFYNFYIHIFPKEVMTISIRVGATSATTMIPKTAFHATAKLWRWAIEDPFETYDSHMPHDLGCHIKEDGMKRIIDAMCKAMYDYEQIMTMPGDYDSDAATATAISRLVNSWLGPSKRLDTKMNDVVGSASTTTITGGSQQQQQQQQRSTNDTRHHSQNNRAQGRGGNGGRGGGRGPSGNNLGQARPRYQGNKSQEQRRRDQQKAGRHRNAQLHEAATREREEIESNIATGHTGGGRKLFIDGQEVGRGGVKSSINKNGAGRLPPQEWNALSDADKARIKKERNDHKA